MKQIFFFISIGLVFFLVSCEDILVKTLPLEDFDYEDQVTFSGILDPHLDSTYVLVSANQAITELENNFVHLENAMVALYYENELIAEGKATDDLIYTMDPTSALLPGDYRLEVAHVNYENVAIANTIIPESVPLKNIRFEEEVGVSIETTERLDAVRLTIEDPPGDNYYLLSFDRFIDSEDTLVQGDDTLFFNNSIYYELYTNDALIVNDWQYGFIFNDEAFDGRDYNLDILIEFYDEDYDLQVILDKFKIKWTTLSKDRYDFILSNIAYQNSQDFGPFSEEVSIHNNVENGLGIFAGQNTQIYFIE